MTAPKSEDRAVAAIMGGLVADAATLGLHWLYDPDRLAQICAGRDVAFLRPDAANYDGAKGVFVHHGKQAGDLSQYGTTASLALAALADEGGKEAPARFAQLFQTTFGPGGTWTGYIDRPTRGALERMAASEQITGIDDDQMPALSTIAAITAAGREEQLLECFCQNNK